MLERSEEVGVWQYGSVKAGEVRGEEKQGKRKIMKITSFPPLPPLLQELIRTILRGMGEEILIPYSAITPLILDSHKYF